jgi:hypothetical protein
MQKIRLILFRTVCDADMATMLMSMRGAWIGEDGVQQGFPSPRGGGQKQFKFEPSSESRSSAQLNGRPGRIRSRFWTFYIWLEAEFHRASNDTGLMPKFILSKRESSKQVDIQNLPWCCVASLMGLRPKLGAPQP